MKPPAVDVPSVTERCMEVIDHEGAPERMSKEQWIELLDSIVSECNSRAQATREELSQPGRR